MSAILQWLLVFLLASLVGALAGLLLLAPMFPAALGAFSFGQWFVIAMAVRFLVHG